MVADKLIPWRDVLADELRRPEFRARWEAAALAREVAAFLVRYRTEHGLTQTALARQLGVRQSQVARLEDGEHEPRLGTLRRLSEALGMSVSVTITPAEPRDGEARSTLAVAVS